MKRSLAGIMAGLAVSAATSANAAEALVDKEAGMVSREITIGNPPLLRETLSCKYAYITVTRGTAVHTIDLLQGLQGPTRNPSVERRLDVARAECNKYGLKPDF